MKRFRIEFEATGQLLVDAEDKEEALLFAEMRINEDGFFELPDFILEIGSATFGTIETIDDD